MEQSEERKYGRLRLFNAAMGCLHLVQGVAMILLSNNYKVPLTTSFLEVSSQEPFGSPVTKTFYDLRIGPLVGVFLLISAVAHFLIASPRIYEWYVRNLKKKINYVRWYEYAASASVMIVVIAMLCGVFDLPTLLLLFSLNATMIFFGLMMELHNQTTKKTDWTAYIFGCFAGFIPWLVLGIYFFGALLPAADKVPTFLYFIFVSLAVFFNIFALNMALQYRAKGRWKNYLFGERFYIILSLVAKSALAWQVFAGTLRPM